MQSKGEVYSVIDLGTNTCLLLAGRLSDHNITKLIEAQEVPRIGRDLYKTGRISEPAFEVVAGIFEKYISISHEYSAKKIIAFGTSALRTADNGDEFIDFILEKTGLKINVIEGYKEAVYSFEGATFDLDRTSSYTVLDIGGGSTELCFRMDDTITASSVEIGSVKLCEIIFKGLFDEARLSDARRYIRNRINELEFPERRSILIGVAGTATTLSAIKHGLKAFDEKVIDQDIMTRDELEEIILNLAAMSDTERLNLGSYMKGRSDIIISGAIIMSEVMKQLRVAKIITRTTGLRYGLLLNIKHFF